MYISLDFKCRDCGHREPRFIKKQHKDFQICHCSHPKKHTLGPMVPLPSATRTNFKFADQRIMK